ncbi:hypothetical protein NDU88_000225 [Pleurodeles waltl]|uniref:Uncharacterized protein n=1 Tax=Pleurodeles waltl TaxID=8319 RepID=A0AAV7S6C9_PLEWA|nr:hypothetical protein NDU88_000225 [Pleurodeles waltl]
MLALIRSPERSSSVLHMQYRFEAVARTCGWAVARTCGWAVARTCGWAVARTCGWTVAQTCGWAVARTCGWAVARTCGWAVARTCGWAVARTCGWAVAQTCGWAVAQTCGWAVAQTCGWAVARTYHHGIRRSAWDPTSVPSLFLCGTKLHGGRSLYPSLPAGAFQWRQQTSQLEATALRTQQPHSAESVHKGLRAFIRSLPAGPYLFFKQVGAVQVYPDLRRWLQLPHLTLLSPRDPLLLPAKRPTVEKSDCQKGNKKQRLAGWRAPLLPTSTRRERQGTTATYASAYAIGCVCEPGNPIKRD